MNRQPIDDQSPNTEEAHLEAHEHEDAQQRQPPRAAVVYETVRLEGEYELSRPALTLAWSGFAAGLSMGFSFLARALLASHLPDAAWSPVISDFGYSVGFIIVILGRQQLFTENTLTPVLELLRRRSRSSLFRVLRLWFIVLAANTIGAFVFALLIGKTPLLDAKATHTLVRMSMDTVSHNFASTLMRGVFAGWLIASLIWLMPFAETARVYVIVIITYVVALGNFSHIIAGSVEALYAVVTGHASWHAFLLHFYLPTLIGNIVGGVPLVALVNYAQVSFIKEALHEKP